MKSFFAVAYTAEDGNSNLELYTEAVIADNANEAVGMSMLEGLGAELHGQNQTIIAVNVSEGDALGFEKEVFGSLLNKTHPAERDDLLRIFSAARDAVSHCAEIGESYGIEKHHIDHLHTVLTKIGA